MVKTAPLAIALLMAFALPASAGAQIADLAQSSEPPQKLSILVTFGDEACPEPEGDEIIVCAQQPESDRYRVPKELRGADDDDVSAGGGSWASAVEAHDDIARLNRPNSCSVVGSNGFTGCTAALLRTWFAERRAP